MQTHKSKNKCRKLKFQIHKQQMPLTKMSHYFIDVEIFQCFVMVDSLAIDKLENKDSNMIKEMTNIK